MKMQWYIMHRTVLLLMVICDLFAASNPSLAQTWTQTSAPEELWSYVASSADGTKLVASATDFLKPDSGMIYTSTNSGSTWITNDVPNDQWFSVASSADGTKLVATGQYDYGNGQIYTSTNGGTMWISNNVPVVFWTSVSSSADGTKLVALAVTNLVYTSTNSGVTWTSNSVPINVQQWLLSASSADAVRLTSATTMVRSARPRGRKRPVRRIKVMEHGQSARLQNQLVHNSTPVVAIPRSAT